MEAPTRGVRPRALAAIALLATIALVAAGASPAEAVPIKRGHTKLILSQSIFNHLDPLGVGILPIAQYVSLSSGASELRLQLRDPRVAIVRHHVHPGPTALLRDGARIARDPDGAL